MNTAANDRRRGVRPKPIPPGLALKLDAAVGPFMRGLQQPYRGLALLALLILASGMWVFWCLDNRMAPLHAHVDSVQREVELRAEIERLETLLDGNEKSHLQTQLQHSIARVIPDYHSLAAWLHAKADRAATAGLRFSYQFQGVPTAAAVDGTMHVPIELEVKINVQSAANNGYKRLLGYLRYIEEDPWLKELRFGEMKSENGQVRVMRLGYALWMLEDPDNPSLTPPADFHTPAVEPGVDIAARP